MADNPLSDIKTPPGEGVFGDHNGCWFDTQSCRSSLENTNNEFNNDNDQYEVYHIFQYFCINHFFKTSCNQNDFLAGVNDTYDPILGALMSPQMSCDRSSVRTMGIRRPGRGGALTYEAGPVLEAAGRSRAIMIGRTPDRGVAEVRISATERVGSSTATTSKGEGVRPTPKHPGSGGTSDGVGVGVFGGPTQNKREKVRSGGAWRKPVPSIQR